jgi:UDP-N-acetylmuramoylalanine--D-glutamate ligase
VRISALEGRRVALWGFGREGRAAHGALRRRLPALPLTVFCNEAEAAEVAAFDDPLLRVDTVASAEALSRFEVVVKSPGISPYGETACAAEAAGTRFVGGSGLWFGERGASTRCVCVTGTKGKSTTTALLAHLLRAGGHRTALAGNIGLPLLDLLDAEAAFWAIELSSYQTRDVALSGALPEVAVATNVFPEHLDWHGGEARYVADKLALFTECAPQHVVLNAADPTLLALGRRLEDGGRAVRWYGTGEGWHLADDMLMHGARKVLATDALPLPGRHNRSNLCAVLAAIEALGLDAEALAAHAAGFQPLPHRLQTLGTRDGLRYVNDSISTTPHATIAALSLFVGQPVAVLVGGHDRGLDWQVFAEALPALAPRAVVTMGANGPRIHAALQDAASATGTRLLAAEGLADAVAKAREALRGQGVVLLSPGAPSFGAFRDYSERGRAFAELAGFDPAMISTLPGLGIA